ncbi:MAG: 30S ribosomal protein S6 [Syntrophales bacterium]|nr:30S ribosomal protein S6 [Syntrophales bacterium]
MRRYEAVAITLADFPDNDIESLIDRYQNIIASQGGSVVRVEKWGRRKLAYEIKKQNKGFYFLLNFVAPQGAVDELERNFKLDDRILRFLTVKLEDRVDMEEVTKELGAKEKKLEASVEEKTEIQEEQK